MYQSRAEKIPQNVIKVTSKGDPVKYIEYGKHILKDTEFQDIKILGSGQSIEVAVKVAEQLRQRIPGLHSIFEVSSVKINKREGIPEGLLDEGEVQTIEITKACVNITLSKDILDTDHYGY
jgi:DNA-binding protein